MSLHPCVYAPPGHLLGAYPVSVCPLQVSPHQPWPRGTPSPGWAESLSEAGYVDTWVPRSTPGASVTMCVQLSPAVPPPCPVPKSVSPVLTALPRRSLMSGTRWCVPHLLLGILASAGQQVPLQADLSMFPLLFCCDQWDRLSLDMSVHAIHAKSPVVSTSLRSYGLWPSRLLCPWDSPGKNNGVGCHILLQGIFLNQGSNPCLLHLMLWQVGSLPSILMPSYCTLCISPTLYIYILYNVALQLFTSRA